MTRRFVLERRAAIFVAGSVVAVLAACAAFFVFRPRPIPASRTSRAEPATSVRPPADVELARQLPAPTPRTGPALVVPISLPPDGIVLDEPALMDTLRELRGSNPALTLQLARDGNQRFKNSADAAERAWFIVKALSDLGRHDEARLEGRKLVDEYRQTRWAEDVHRHLFVNPPTHPFERGYGKVLESEP